MPISAAFWGGTRCDCIQAAQKKESVRQRSYHAQQQQQVSCVYLYMCPVQLYNSRPSQYVGATPGRVLVEKTLNPKLWKS